MTKGSKGRSAMEVAQAVDALGASISGSASRDAMTFSAGGLSRDPEPCRRSSPTPCATRTSTPKSSSASSVKRSPA